MNNRAKTLAINIARYLSEWMDDESLNVPVRVSKKAIESYGVSFDRPNDSLAVAAVRHIIDIVSPWNRQSICAVLEEQCCFTEIEANRYFEATYDV
ncbi:MAG: hypothetical protein LBP26_07540 [Clostridiales bacterium]|jgi:hypothetical protein|nr:hypothetical protein [Clostridiales bacterium]